MVVAITWNKMEWEGLFRSIIFTVSHPEVILYPSLDSKIIDLIIPNPKLKLLPKEQKTVLH